jgi:hypothetical protein
MRLLALAVIALPSLAEAACRGEPVFSCKIGSKAVEVCLLDSKVSYTFGPPGKPELALTKPVKDVDFSPWPGIGRTTWEAAVISNDGVDYEIWYSIDRLTDTKETQGGINVLRGNETLAGLECKPETIDQNLYALFEAKEDVGQCWNAGSETWISGC